MDLDVDKFIFEIEQRPAIWNMKSKDYSDRIQKIKKWEEIINIFTDESLPFEEKKKQRKLLQKRWKTPRDAFVKERRELASDRSGSAASNKKQYKYYKQLLFLLPVVSTNTTHNSMVIEEDKDPVDMPHEESMITPRPKKIKKIDPTDEIGSELINVLKSTMQQKTQEEDPDRQFMLSLVSDFKRVSPRLKPMVKINILKCIMEAQAEIYDSHQVQHAEPHKNSLYLYFNQQYEGYYTRSQEQGASRRPNSNEQYEGYYTRSQEQGVSRRPNSNEQYEGYYTRSQEQGASRRPNSNEQYEGYYTRSQEQGVNRRPNSNEQYEGYYTRSQEQGVSRRPNSNEQYEGYYTRSQEQGVSRRPSYQPSTSFHQAHDQPRENCYETDSPNIQQSLSDQEDPPLPAFATPQHENQTSPKSVNTQNSIESELLPLFDI